jgi:tyrosine-protein kinase Etk/Wzc
MNEQQTTVLEPAAASDVHEFGLMDVTIALAKHKKFVVGAPLAVGIIAAAFSLTMPNVYRATTKLLPPQQAQSGASALLAQLGGAAGMAAGVTGLKNPNDLYVGMLKSRTVADRLLTQYDLKKVYETPSTEEARRTLEGNTVVTSGKDGLITIQVDDKDQKLVARLANAYVAELLQLTKVLAVTEAGQRRLFYERQLELAKNDLAKAEASLKGKLDARGVISVDSESATIVGMVARLRAQVSAKEIELDSMRAFVTASHPGYRRVQEEIHSLRAELSKLENGRQAAEPRDDASDTQSTGFQNIQLLRDIKYQQMLYELLAKQYEVARLDEAKQPSVIQVLDPAVDPERKAKPQRSLIVLAFTFASLVATILWVLLLEIKQRAMLSPTRAAKWNELRTHLRLKKRAAAPRKLSENVMHRENF